MQPYPAPWRPAVARGGSQITSRNPDRTVPADGRRMPDPVPPSPPNAVAVRRAPRSPARLLAFALAAVLVVACGPIGGVPATPRVPTTDPPAGSLPDFTRVWVVVLENKGYDAIVGSADAPFLNSLIADYGLAEDLHGVGRPSQPNYLALFSGATHGVADNDPHDIDAPTVADQLEAAGRTWAVFAENVPPDCYRGEVAEGGRDGPGDYARKHEPAISFKSIADDPARCARIQDFSAFRPDAADLSLIIPNLCHDMHDCSIRDGDSWLASFVPRIVETPDWTSGGLLIVTFDEGDPDGGPEDRVATIVVSPDVAAGYRSDARLSHYSVLRTVEAAWGLPCLAESCYANTLQAFFEH